VSNKILDQTDIWELLEVDMRNGGIAISIKDARK